MSRRPRDVRVGPHPPPRGLARGYLAALAIVALCTLPSVAGAEILPATAFVLVFPVGVLVAAARFGIGPAALAAVAGVLAFDFVFVPPRLAFAIPGAKDGLTLAVMVAVATLVSVLAEQLRRQAQAAHRQTEVERVRNALLCALSHDLRTPLTVLVGASSALCEERLDPRQRREFSRMVADESRRLSRLVGNLLELTRLESGRAHVKQTAQAVDEVIGAALCRLEGQLEGRSVRTHVEDDVPLVFFDPVLLEQVVINLIENAIRHAGPASPIEIAARLEGDAILVEVADRGPGVPPEHEEKVFEKFYRAPGASQGDGGIGLGLTICRAIIAAHDGLIWFTNRPGGGAIVRFTLPVCSSARALESPRSERALVEALRS
jgi:two-component system sensor histidine kinase KdpD